VSVAGVPLVTFIAGSTTPGNLSPGFTNPRLMPVSKIAPGTAMVHEMLRSATAVFWPALAGAKPAILKLMTLACGVTLFEQVEAYSAKVGPAGRVVVGATVVLVVLVDELTMVVVVVPGEVVPGVVAPGEVVTGVVVPGVVVPGVVLPVGVVVAGTVVAGAVTLTDAMGDVALGANTAGAGPPEPAQQWKLALMALLTRLRIWSGAELRLATPGVVALSGAVAASLNTMLPPPFEVHVESATFTVAVIGLGETATVPAPVSVTVNERFDVPCTVWVPCTVLVPVMVSLTVAATVLVPSATTPAVKPAWMMAVSMEMPTVVLARVTLPPLAIDDVLGVPFSGTWKVVHALLMGTKQPLPCAAADTTPAGPNATDTPMPPATSAVAATMRRQIL